MPSHFQPIRIVKYDCLFCDFRIVHILADSVLRLQIRQGTQCLLHHDDVMACQRIQRYLPFVREFTGDWCRWKIPLHQNSLPRFAFRIFKSKYGFTGDAVVADRWSIWHHCINEPLEESACGKVPDAKDSIRLLVSVMHTVLSSNIGKSPVVIEILWVWSLGGLGIQVIQISKCAMSKETEQESLSNRMVNLIVLK